MDAGDGVKGSGASPHADWLLWQLADSSFPAGSFAHSAGLEAAWQQGELRNGSDLAAFMDASLTQFGHGSLPFMTAAHLHPERLVELDWLCDCLTTNHVANRASRSQGRAWLLSAQRIFAMTKLGHGPRSAPPEFPCGHLAPVFGAVLRALEVGCDDAARLFCFSHLRGLTASAVRLGIIGPLEGQQLQHGFGPRLDEILSTCRGLSVDDLAQTAPLIDLWQGLQDRLYSRLFQS
jgi:urease accessory protein